MAKINEIIKNKSYTEFKDYCDENGFILSEDVKDDSYIFSATSTDESNDVIINGIVTDSSVSIYVTNSDGTSIVDKFVQEYTTDDELFDLVKGSLATADLLNNVDDTDSDLLMEDDSESGYSTIPGGLEEIKSKIKDLADELKELSGLSQNVEIISSILDISNGLYSTVMDVDDVVELYNEVMEIDIEEDDEQLDPETDNVDESIDLKKLKSNLYGSILAVKKLSKINMISNESANKFMKSCEELLG